MVSWLAHFLFKNELIKCGTKITKKNIILSFLKDDWNGHRLVKHISTPTELVCEDTGFKISSTCLLLNRTNVQLQWYITESVQNNSNLVRLYTFHRVSSN